MIATKSQLQPDLKPAAVRSESVGSTATLTWLHLSDLHFCKSQAYDANVVLKALLRDLAEQQVRPDFIAISGDIAFSAQRAEYDMAQRFFDDLLGTTGLDKDRLFLVPGNHDISRGLVGIGAQAIGDSLTNRNRVNSLLDVPHERKLLFDRFKGYAAFVKAYLGKERRFDDNHFFYVQSLDLAGRRVALLCLNSAWLCASDEDRAKGLLIGERQARIALEQAGDADLQIALLHHPFDWLREFDQNDSAAMLADRCDFVLHGHLHQTAASQLISPDGAAIILACGACYETRSFPNMYNWVRLDLAAGAGTVHLRRYSDARGGFWATDTLTYKNVRDGVYNFRLPGKCATPQGEITIANLPLIHTTTPVAKSLPAETWDSKLIEDELNNGVRRKNRERIPNRGELERDLKAARRALARLEDKASRYTALTMPSHLKSQLQEQRRIVSQLEQDCAE
jgi:UDP-2,3-diacylglucosamine pyrophosphatase LpxH